MGDVAAYHANEARSLSDSLTAAHELGEARAIQIRVLRRALSDALSVLQMHDRSKAWNEERKRCCERAHDALSHPTR